MNKHFKELQDKQNFLTWYRMATREDIEKARAINNKLYEELLSKYKVEVEVINLRKGTLKEIKLYG
jgi:hypothetical protein